MSYVLSWVGTKDGQGVSTSALATAWELALRYRVLLVDADQSGTGTLADLLDAAPEQHGMGRFAGRVRAITADMLRAEALQIPRNRNLFVVPGLNGACGKPAYALAAELEQGDACTALPFHFLVIDWGAAWSHSGLDSPARSADAVCRISDRVFVQLLDSPVLLTRAIRVLQQARPAKAELVLAEARPKQLRKELQAALAGHLPDLGLAATIPWSPRAAMQAEDGGAIMTEQGRSLALQLQLAERAQPVLEARRHQLAATAEVRG